MIILAQINEAEGTRHWICPDHPQSPREMDGANKWSLGFYAVDDDLHDSDDAWSWEGPYETEAEAENAAKEEER